MNPDEYRELITAPLNNIYEVLSQIRDELRARRTDEPAKWGLASHTCPVCMGPTAVPFEDGRYTPRTDVDESVEYVDRSTGAKIVFRHDDPPRTDIEHRSTACERAPYERVFNMDKAPLRPPNEPTDDLPITRE